MFSSFRLNRIVKKAVKKTAKHFKGCQPEMLFHTFYGAFDISPRNLTVWYIFKTESDLHSAKESGLCCEIEKLTVENLIVGGYPKDAFEVSGNGLPTDVVASHGVGNEEIQNVMFSLSNRKAAVSFASQEEIDKKADGDYRLFFQ